MPDGVLAAGEAAANGTGPAPALTGLTHCYTAPKCREAEVAYAVEG